MTIQYTITNSFAGTSRTVSLEQVTDHFGYFHTKDLGIETSRALRYSVTHLPSTRRACYTPTQKEAKAACQELEEIEGVDWDWNDEHYLFSLPSEIQERIMAVRAQYKEK